MSDDWIEAATDLPFLKVTGGGNDFILVDNRNGRLAGDLAAFVRAVCHRGLGVGADGVILVEWSERADLRMAYFNSDGGVAALCGNGLRCLVRWAAASHAAPSRMTVETGAGVLQAEGGTGAPRFRLPLGAEEPRPLVLDAGSSRYEGILVQAGVPHFAVRCADAFAPDRLRDAPALRAHPDLGPAGANVDFFSPCEGGLLLTRYYERGVEAETLSSGTGSIAAARAAAFLGLGPGPWTCRNREGLEVTVTLETTAAGAVEAILAGEVGFLYHGRLRREIFERRAGSGPAPTTAPGKANRA